MQISAKLNGLHYSLRSIFSSNLDRTLTITDINKVLKLILTVTNFYFSKNYLYHKIKHVQSQQPLLPPKPFGKFHPVPFAPTSFFQNFLITTPFFEISQKFSSPLLLKRGRRSPLQ